MPALNSDNYQEKIKVIHEFSDALQKHTAWFKELGIELYSSRELDKQYSEYVQSFENGDEEFRAFHRKEWYSLAKNGMLAAVLDDSGPELIQFHYHCGGVKDNNHFFGICKEPDELLMLLETPLSAKAFDLGCEYLVWTNGYRGQMGSSHFKPFRHAFSAIRLYKNTNNRDAVETQIRFPHYLYTYNHLNDLSFFRAQLTPANGITWLNYGISLKPVSMRFTDDCYYMPETKTVTVRELMKFLISKLPLQCVELVALSARYPFGYLHIMNEVFKNGRPEGVIVGTEEFLQNIPDYPQPEKDSFGNNFFPIQSTRPRADALLISFENWSFTFAYPGAYIPVEFLGQFRHSPLPYKKLTEKARDKHEYSEKAAIYENNVIKDLTDHFFNKSTFDWREDAVDGSEEEIY